MGRENQQAISRESVEAYLRRTGHPAATVVSMRPLGGDENTDSAGQALKSFGYGCPLRITFVSGTGVSGTGVSGTGPRDVGKRDVGQEEAAQQRQKDVVLRTMSPDPYGHGRRADRVAAMVQSYDTFGCIPQHVLALDVGTLTPDGLLLSAGGAGEPFLLTEYVSGSLYAADITALAHGERGLSAQDEQRAMVLARYLVALHAETRPQEEYVRFVRDTLGSGEGIFGILDGYPADDPVASPKRLQALEAAWLPWRWHLKKAPTRARRTHGDFHPFNILFREGAAFSVLDCSRGAVGDPADDVTCLAVNYLFFSLVGAGSFGGPLRRLWDVFWSTYLQHSGDEGLLAVVAPFFVWRLGVLASPVWYPDVSVEVRERLFAFAERLLLRGAAFDPADVDAWL